MFQWTLLIYVVQVHFFTAMVVMITHDLFHIVLSHVISLVVSNASYINIPHDTGINQPFTKDLYLLCHATALTQQVLYMSPVAYLGNVFKPKGYASFST